MHFRDLNIEEKGACFTLKGHFLLRKIGARYLQSKKKKNWNFGRIRRVIVRAGVGVNFREPPDEIGRVGISGIVLVDLIEFSSIFEKCSFLNAHMYQKTSNLLRITL